MRFSPLHFLLLGAAFAAPVQDVQPASKHAEEDGLVARGLVPLLARSPTGPIIVPKPVLPRPGVKPPPPKAPGGPVKTPPKGPGPHGDLTGPPPPLIPSKDGPSPGDKPDAAPGDKPDPVNRPDSDLDSPVGACGVKRGICVNEDLNTPITDGEILAFQDAGKINLGRLQARRDSTTAVDNPPAGNGVLKDNPGYKPWIQSNKKADGSHHYNPEDQKYLQNDKFKHAFKNDDFEEISFFPDANQKALIKNWAQSPAFDAALGSKKDDFMAKMVAQAKIADTAATPMLKSLNNPKEGSMVVQKIFKENDPYQKDITVTVKKNPELGISDDFTFKRPGFPESDSPGAGPRTIHPSDQILNSYKQSLVNYNAEIPLGQKKAKVEDLNYIGMDEMITPDTKKLADELMSKTHPQRPGEKGHVDGISIMSGTDDVNAMSGTGQSSPVIRMLTQHHAELGKPKVAAYHLTRKRISEKTDPNEAFRYDMVIELAR